MVVNSFMKVLFISKVKDLKSVFQPCLPRISVANRFSWRGSKLTMTLSERGGGFFYILLNKSNVIGNNQGYGLYDQQ